MYAGVIFGLRGAVVRWGGSAHASDFKVQLGFKSLGLGPFGLTLSPKSLTPGGWQALILIKDAMSYGAGVW